MDNKFLDKVLDQIVSETEIIDGMVYTPFYPSSLSFSPFFRSFSFYFFSFSYHCKNVYGLNEQEIDYIWDEYKEIILNKTNGL